MCQLVLELDNLFLQLLLDVFRHATLIRLG
jgi:hypothetical protein